MFKILGFVLFIVATFGIIACGDSSSTSGPDSNNISCKSVVLEDTVITTQKSSSGKTIKTLAIVGDSITEVSQIFYYDDDIKKIFIDNCEETPLQKCGKDNITVYSAAKPRGSKTIDSLAIADRLIRVESSGNWEEYRREDFGRLSRNIPWISMYR